MTWGVRITKDDGTVPENYHSACTKCLHGGDVWPTPCYINRAAYTIGNFLTSIDRGADGHMACGTAELRCAGFEAVEEVPNGAV